MTAIRHAGSPAVCPTGTHHRTTRVRHSARHAGPCWVQNQNQNQTVVTTALRLSWLRLSFIVTSVKGDE